MKKQNVIKLTESDLVKIVQRVISENKQPKKTVAPKPAPRKK